MSDYLPPVVARLSMDLGDFAAKVEEAKSMLRGLGDTINVKLDIDKGLFSQMAQDLEAIHRLLGAQQVTNIKANLDDGAARARLDALTRDRTVNVKVDVDKNAGSTLLATLTGGLTNRFAGFAGANLPGFLPAVPAGGLGVAAIAGIAAALAGALPLLDMLVSGFAAAGAGAVAFGAMAYPAITSVSQAYSQLKTYQDAYTQAQAAYKVDPSTQNAQALRQAADAVKAYQAQIAQLPQAQQTALQGVNALINAGSNLQQAFQPTAFQVFNAGLKALNALLPAALPMAKAFGGALTGLLNQLAKFAASPGFQNWLKQFTALIGPSVKAIGQGIGQVAIAFGKLLTIFSGKDVATTIHATFDVIVGALTALGAVIKGVAAGWNYLSSTMKSEASAIATDWNALVSIANGVARGVAAAWDSLVGSARAVYTGVMSAWHSMISGIETAGSTIIGFVRTIPGRIASAFSSLPGKLLQIGRDAMTGLLHGLEAIGSAVLGYVEHLASSVISAAARILHINSPSLVFYGIGQSIGEGLIMGMQASVPHVMRASAALAAAATAGGGSPAGQSWIRDTGPARFGGGAPGGGPALAGQGGGVIVVESHLYLDGRELHSAMTRQAGHVKSTTGRTNMGRRTR